MFKSKMIEILSKTKVFEDMTLEELKTISKHCEKISFEKGDILIGINREPSGFFILVKGQLSVLLPERMEGRRERRASSINLNVLNEGDCFGEYSLLEKTRTTASVIAKKPGEALKIPKSYFNQILADNQMAKTIYRNMLHILIKRLRKKETELDLILLAS
ncbi:MAG: cyclic nucleotide-binding domain-containing protein [Deltaproteobacteria bacterium]|nr:cyclic nucleotide-binding domain-containing protein [Deltaproteobacteria bacterium]